VRLDNYPNLERTGYTETSKASAQYNCIAWAAGDSNHWWWPFQDPPPYAYWPNQAPREDSLDAFIRAFETLGYFPCENSDLENGFEKVAFYGDSGGPPKHAARQLATGKWTSKIGQSEDIEHTFDGLRQCHYGEVILILKRPVAVPRKSESLWRRIFRI
jgi:hypothetical protein